MQSTCRSWLAGDEALEPCGDVKAAIAGKSAPTADVHKFSFFRPSISIFNRSQLAVPAFMSYHFRK